MREKRLIMLIVAPCLLICQAICAQQGSTDNQSDLLKPIEVIPPAPNAASLGKFGGINFGLHSGAMSTSIPVFSYSSKNLAVPITLSYNTTGFKVDEIASRAGVSWDLNAGGVITRTVYGAVDEYSIRLTPPAFSPFSRNLIDDFLKPVSYSNSTGGYDAQPDRFSFNFCGYTGQFILDANLHPVLLSHSGLKVEDNFNTANPDWDFKITTPDGVAYYFGGDLAREVTNKRTGGNCGHDLPDFTPTAFYLKTIVHPNNDAITLTYESCSYNYKTGISQNVFYRTASHFACTNFSYNTCPTLNNYISSCTSWLQTSGVVLKEISSASGGRVVFLYKDRLDVPNDKLITGIEIHQSVTDAIIRKFDFLYDDILSTAGSNDYNSDNTLGYRHFLTTLTESSADSKLSKQYKFVYNDLDHLPRRLSYGQDHYGYYNGKTTNTSLIPKPEGLAEQLIYFTIATANREPNPDFCRYGLLSKIIYPTGGSDTIIYEGNTMYAQTEVLPPVQEFYVTADSEEYPFSSTANSGSADISFDQETAIYGSCEFYGSSGEEDPIHNKAIIYLYDNSNIIYQTTLLPGESIITSLNTILTLKQGNSYYLKVVASGTKVRAYASFSARPGNKSNPYQNITMGGVRVAKLISRSASNNPDVVKKYYYAALDNLDRSSGINIYSPVYNKVHTVVTACERTFEAYDCNTNTCVYEGLFSTSQTSLIACPGQPVSYQFVTEGFGENFENGGIQHQYTYEADMPGEIILNDNIIGAPLSNQSIKSGREIFTYTFKYSGSSFIPVKKVFTHYNDDSRYSDQYSAYVINRKGPPGCEDDPPYSFEDDIWDVYRYSIFTNWYYADTVRTLTYDMDGQSYNEQVLLTSYNNPDHALPTRIATNQSDLRQSIINNYYPQDVTLSGPEETARQALVAKHIIAPVIQQLVFKDVSQVSKTVINYKVFDNGLVLPYEQYYQTFNNALEKRHQFSQYNQYGQLLQQLKLNDSKSNYLWDYNSTYPIAMVTNAESADIAYTSFEADGSGNWNIISTERNANGITGTKSYQLDKGSVTASGLNTATEYFISYWSSNGAYSVNGTIGSPVQGKTTTINNITWTYFQHRVSGVTTITVSGAGGIDELRLFPKGALMTSYTFEPVIGMTSQCDAGNNIIYFEYDGLQRLLRVRDAEGNILKQYDYQYQTYGTNTPVWQATGNTRCKPCPGNNNYITNIKQQEEADVNPISNSGTRWTDIGTSTDCVIQPDWQNTSTAMRCRTVNGINNGEREQEQADINPCSSSGTRWVVVDQNCTVCPKPANWQPTGNMRCVVNDHNNNTGDQEREEKDNESCSATAGQTRWVNIGQNVSACPICTTSNCTGQGYKCVYGACEFGVKVYTSSVYIEWKLYKCTYHYEWSDGSWSQNYTEESATTCR